MLQAGSLLVFEDSNAWVPGWQRSIHQALNRAIPNNATSHVPAGSTALLVGDFLRRSNSE